MNKHFLVIFLFVTLLVVCFLFIECNNIRFEKPETPLEQYYATYEVDSLTWRVPLHSDSNKVVLAEIFDKHKNLVGNAEFKNAEQNGKTTLFYSDGKTKSVMNYVNGLLSGKTFHYYKDGNMSQSLPYKDGVLEGVGTFYHENGNIKSISRFLDGKLTGQTSWFSITGALEKIEQYSFEEKLVFQADFGSGKRMTEVWGEDLLIRTNTNISNEGTFNLLILIADLPNHQESVSLRVKNQLGEVIETRAFQPTSDMFELELTYPIAGKYQLLFEVLHQADNEDIENSFSSKLDIDFTVVK